MEGFCPQIFEIEEQLDSALDTHDQGAPPLMGLPRSRPIGRPRGSTAGSNTYSRVPSQSSRKPDSSPGPHLRHRITTALSRPSEMAAQASPLAQLFQPLIVDEVIPEVTQPYTGPRDIVSYGPVSRRRLSSGTTLQRMIQSSREGDTLAVQNPDQRSDASWEPETAEETAEKEATLGSLEWERRLNALDRGQKRIEELLDEIVSRMGGEGE